MSLIINHNLTAQNTTRNLNDVYGNLSVSVQRLSTGLRINSAADDAAGLAIREGMRADISALNQGIRNAQDGISMIQTAEGALSVIDEKLIRMKELAEQAATGTYTNEQRLIIHSEFAAMAAEIDRIASATDFNGVNFLTEMFLCQEPAGNGQQITPGVQPKEPGLTHPAGKKCRVLPMQMETLKVVLKYILVLVIKELKIITSSELRM